jgi:hypothetical protein
MSNKVKNPILTSIGQVRDTDSLLELFKKAQEGIDRYGKRKYNDRFMNEAIRPPIL